MMPRWWFPLLELSENQTEIGFTTSGNDALGIHRYLLNASYDTQNQWFTGGITYNYSNRLQAGFQRTTDIVLDNNGNFAMAIKEDDVFVSYAFPITRVDYNWKLIVGAFSSHDYDGRREPIYAPFEFKDNLLGVASLFNNSKHYIRSISANDGRDVRLVVESSDVWSSDFSGQVYTLDWREYIRLSGQHVLAIRLAEGYGTDIPDNFSLGGEETDFMLSEFFETFYKPVFGRREYPLRGYPEGLPQLNGRRMQLGSIEYRFPLGLVERGIMAPPVGIIQWAGSLFIDSGAVWHDGRSPEKYYTGAGIELHADINLFYGLNMKARLGFASGLDDQLGEDRLYFSLGAAF